MGNAVDFTNQKPFVVTERDMKFPWGGYRDGRRFRCGLCGHRFAKGDTARWVYLGGSGLLNAFVCQGCDGSNESIINRLKEIRSEFHSDKFWLFREMG